MSTNVGTTNHGGTLRSFLRKWKPKKKHHHKLNGATSGGISQVHEVNDDTEGRLGFTVGGASTDNEGDIYEVVSHDYPRRVSSDSLTVQQAHPAIRGLGDIADDILRSQNLSQWTADNTLQPVYPVENNHIPSPHACSDDDYDNDFEFMTLPMIPKRSQSTNDLALNQRVVINKCDGQVYINHAAGMHRLDSLYAVPHHRVKGLAQVAENDSGHDLHPSHYLIPGIYVDGATTVTHHEDGDGYELNPKAQAVGIYVINPSQVDCEDDQQTHRCDNTTTDSACHIDTHEQVYAVIQKRHGKSTCLKCRSTFSTGMVGMPALTLCGMCRGIYVIGAEHVESEDEEIYEDVTLPSRRKAPHPDPICTTSHTRTRSDTSAIHPTISEDSATISLPTENTVRIRRPIPKPRSCSLKSPIYENKLSSDTDCTENRTIHTSASCPAGVSRLAGCEANYANL